MAPAAVPQLGSVWPPAATKYGGTGAGAAPASTAGRPEHRPRKPQMAAAQRGTPPPKLRQHPAAGAEGTAIGTGDAGPRRRSLYESLAAATGTAYPGLFAFSGREFFTKYGADGRRLCRTPVAAKRGTATDAGRLRPGVAPLDHPGPGTGTRTGPAPARLLAPPAHPTLMATASPGPRPTGPGATAQSHGPHPAALRHLLLPILAHPPPLGRILALERFGSGYALLRRPHPAVYHGTDRPRHTGLHRPLFVWTALGQQSRHCRRHLPHLVPQSGPARPPFGSTAPQAPARIICWET